MLYQKRGAAGTTRPPHFPVLRQRSSADTLRIMKTWKQICAVSALLAPSLLIAQTPADAIALQQRGKLAESAVAWRVITQRNPKDAAAFAAWGSVLSQEGKYEEAAPVYKKALALNPKL